jgi:hypothetical protein
MLQECPRDGRTFRNFRDARNGKCFLICGKVRSSGVAWCVWEKEVTVDSHRKSDYAIDDESADDLEVRYCDDTFPRIALTATATQTGSGDHPCWNECRSGESRQSLYLPDRMR